MQTAVGKVEERIYLQCSNCKEEVYTCDRCKEYFKENDEIFCDIEHYCSNCVIIDQQETEDKNG